VTLHGRLQGARSWWNDISVTTKGYVVLAIPVVCLLVVASVSLALGTEIVSLRGTSQQLVTSVDRLDATLEHMTAVEDDVRGYVVTGDPRYTLDYRADRRPLAGGIVPNPGAYMISPRTVAPLNSTGARALSLLGSIEAQKSAGTLTSPAATALFDREDSLMVRARRELAGVRSIVNANLTANKVEAADLRQTLLIVDIAGLVVGTVGGALAAWLFLSGISRRIRRVAANAELLGREQPMEPMPPARDAIGVVEAELETASNRLAQRTEELREARDVAVAATRAKDDFISRVSHELRTPLTTVLGFGELLQSEDLSEDNRDSVDRIVRAGRHLLNLINDLLDIGRIERGYLTLNLAAVGVREEVEDLLANMAPLAARRGVVLESVIGDAAVVADRQRLQQILLNLVSNAIKYNHEGGRVVLSDSERRDGMVRIEVHDTGPGIAADALDRIFVPFERLEAERGGIEGTGIGLALSKALAEAMHGRVGVQSSLGLGSTFWVELPVGGVPSAAGDASLVDTHP